MGKFKAIIFDMDGLLIDSEGLYRKVSYEMAGMLGKRLTDEILARQMGRSPLESLRIFRQELGIETHSAEELTQLRNDLMIREFRNQLLMMPGAKRIIGRFHSRKRLAIATGSPETLVREVMEITGLAGSFEHIQTSDGIRLGKPDPEIYLRAIRAMGLNPEECIVLEDSGNGVMAGHRAGCYVIAVPNTHTRDQDFSRADAVVLDLDGAASLIEVLEQRDDFVEKY
ncbi:MAG: HAD family phosphatase [Bacteroidales bacterium]